MVVGDQSMFDGDCGGPGTQPYVPRSIAPQKICIVSIPVPSGLPDIRKESSYDCPGVVARSW